MKPMKYICCSCDDEPIIFAASQDIENPECPNCWEDENTIPLHYLDLFPNTYKAERELLNKTKPERKTA